MVNLDIKLTGNGNTIIPERAVFVERFLDFYGSLLKQLCFSACTKLVDCYLT